MNYTTETELQAKEQTTEKFKQTVVSKLIFRRYTATFFILSI